jgi:HD-GYP domain-containing protein (c-di-GMP phosphodiesterase class II)
MEVSSFYPLGVGLLLHDVGKTTIDPKIINKKGKLTQEEFEVIKTHPEEGFCLLKERREISEESLTVVLQHHENYDCTTRKGYPKGIEGDGISLFGRIAHIIDVYDALTTRRIYSEAKDPFPTLKIMKEEMLDHFQKELFIEFIKFLGPTGGLRTVKDGEGT